MGDWLEEYAAALEDRLGGPAPGIRLRKQDRGPILSLARVVAHGTERKNAPLAAYVAGRYVALRTRQGAGEAEALAEAVAVAEEITPPGG